MEKLFNLIFVFGFVVLLGMLCAAEDLYKLYKANKPAIDSFIQRKLFIYKLRFQNNVWMMKNGVTRDIIRFALVSRYYAACFWIERKLVRATKGVRRG